MADSLPLNPQIARGLNDKIYDKRKAAALEVERLIRDHLANNDKEKIHQILKVLVNDFAYAPLPNARNGGLIGLAAASIALGQDVIAYLHIIVAPVLACFLDADSRVRYYACESMYNIAKVAKGEILLYFNDIFDALSKLAADPELSVKNGAELLDRLIKDTVAEFAATYYSVVAPPFTLPTVSGERGTAFSLPRFIPLLSERIHTLHPFTRNYLISWITVLNSIPDLELVTYLPKFLDGLLRYLSDANSDVRVGTATVLGDFLREIREAAEVRLQREHDHQRYLAAQREQIQVPTLDQVEGGDIPAPDIVADSFRDGTIPYSEHDHMAPAAAVWADALSTNESNGKGKGVWVPGQELAVDYAKIVEILLPHVMSSEEELQLTALRWINEFILLARDVMIATTPQLVATVLPCLAHSVSATRNVAVETNANLHQLILETPLPENQLDDSDSVITSADQNLTQLEMPALDVQGPSLAAAAKTPSTSSIASTMVSAQNVTSALLSTEISIAVPSETTNFLLNDDKAPLSLAADIFDYQATVNALTLHFLSEHEETRSASLDWLLMLHKKAPRKIIDDGTFPALLKTLSDPSEEVVRRDLQLLAQISSQSDDEYFSRLMLNLLSLFSTDRRLLETRGSLIIRQLCLSLNPERIYRTFAEILEKDEDLEFASMMVQNLNIILITAPELVDVRKRLRNLETKDGQMLFSALYKSWCHNAVATFSLCLLAQAYEHASNLLQLFAELEVTVNLLIQIDKLVQLLESPVFTYLRLQLLEPDRYPHLFKCLYGILMLLPQSSAFATLRNRLSSVSSLGVLHLVPRGSSGVNVGSPSSVPEFKTRTLKSTGNTSTSASNDFKIQDLLAHFTHVQSKHERSWRTAMHTGSRSHRKSHRHSTNYASGKTSNSNNMDNLNPGSNIPPGNGGSSSGGTGMDGARPGGKLGPGTGGAPGALGRGANSGSPAMKPGTYRKKR